MERKFRYLFGGVNSISQDEYKNCPYCDEEIKSIAIKCRYCHSLLDELSISKIEKMKERSIADIVDNSPNEKPVNKLELDKITDGNYLERTKENTPKIKNEIDKNPNCGLESNPKMPKDKNIETSSFQNKQKLDGKVLVASKNKEPTPSGGCISFLVFSMVGMVFGAFIYGGIFGGLVLGIAVWIMLVNQDKKESKMPWD